MNNYANPLMNADVKTAKNMGQIEKSLEDLFSNLRITERTISEIVETVKFPEPKSPCEIEPVSPRRTVSQNIDKAREDLHICNGRLICLMELLQAQLGEERLV